MLDTAPRMIYGNWEAGVPSTETMRFFSVLEPNIWNQNQNFQQYTRVQASPTKSHGQCGEVFLSQRLDSTCFGWPFAGLGFT